MTNGNSVIICLVCSYLKKNSWKIERKKNFFSTLILKLGTTEKKTNNLIQRKLM